MHRSRLTVEVPAAAIIARVTRRSLSFQGFRGRVIRLSGKKNPTGRDFITISGRGTLKEQPMFAGNPSRSPIRWRNGLPHRRATGL